ncbi:penicillin-binding transpeptidase domain-containing protein [Cryomorphaceae bacterium 1068]|nr:penicillin-binding transpeptidase domain-containing protein [Cryomorphaceae bacterium 1068]
MKNICPLIFILLFNSCDWNRSSEISETTAIPPQEILVPAFQALIDSADVEGAILIYDLEKDQYHSNDFGWSRKGQLPASTFKITNSMIALETGVIEDDSTLIKWDGEDRRMKVWEQDLVFRDAFHFSCVPCYQEIAREIGVERMNGFLSKLNYGSMVVDSASIDLFWLVGDSKITPFEQIHFLERFYHSEMPISEQTETTMKRLMIIEETEAYTISGKTGWSIRNGKDNGWFVGYLEVPENTYFFATNVEPKANFEMDRFQMIRKDLSYKAFKEMRLIE